MPSVFLPFRAQTRWKSGGPETMKQGRFGRRALRSGSGSRGMAAMAGAVLLASVAVVIGGVGYAVLSEVGHMGASTSTLHSCSPPGMPECSGHGNSTASPTALGVGAPSDR